MPRRPLPKPAFTTNVNNIQDSNLLTSLRNSSTLKTHPGYIIDLKSKRERGKLRMADRVVQQLGNYRLMHLLGRGGFAEVGVCGW